MSDLVERLRTERSVYDAELCDEAIDEIERLRAALAIPKWKSCHKDNMEFSATISCYTMDKIRQALNVKNFSVRQINTMLANCVDNPQLISETLIVFIAARNHAIDNGRLILAGELTAAINSLRKKI